MSDNPLVSAVIPTYNRAKLVTQAIDSVLNQSYRNIEVIVVDDGSTDDTVAQLKLYGDRVRVVSQKNAGPAAARNRGINEARGEFIAFLDSDDLWLPDKIQRQVTLMKNVDTSVPCCLCNISMRWNAGERATFDIAELRPPAAEGVWVNVDEVLATRFVLFNQGIMIRSDVLRRLGGFNQSLWYLEDHELALRLSLEGPWAFIREPLVIWRETGKGSLYANAKGNELCWKEPMVRILEAHLARLNSATQRDTLRRCVTRELRRARRELRGAQISNMSFWGARILGNILGKIEQYRRAFFRRSPWFPQMKVTQHELHGSNREAVPYRTAGTAAQS